MLCCRLKKQVQELASNQAAKANPRPKMALLKSAAPASLLPPTLASQKSLASGLGMPICKVGIGAECYKILCVQVVGLPNGLRHPTAVNHLLLSVVASQDSLALAYVGPLHRQPNLGAAA